MKSGIVGPFSPEMLSQILSGVASQRRDDYDVSILPEGQVMTLKEYQGRYQDTLENGSSFAPGDMITPRPGCGTKGVGEPHIVLEVRHAGKIEPHWKDDASSSGQGKRLDLRVACFVNNDNVAAFWVESHEYEPYPHKD